jgi:hypothetical protein
LKPKGVETGGWSATISALKGALQVQADAVVAFPIPLAKGETVKFTYRTATEAAAPKAPCFGSVNEPVAEGTLLAGGNLCVYRGGVGLGSKESEDENAKEVQFEDFLGEPVTATGEANSGDLGVNVVFRTTTFTTPVHSTLPANAYLVAKGSWALKAAG